MKRAESTNPIVHGALPFLSVFDECRERKSKTDVRMAYETKRVLEMSFSNISPEALDVICARVIAVGLLSINSTSVTCSVSEQRVTNPMSKHATTMKMGSSATFVVANAYHAKSGNSTNGVTIMRLITATMTVRVSPVDRAVGVASITIFLAPSVLLLKRLNLIQGERGSFVPEVFGGAR